MGQTTGKIKAAVICGTMALTAVPASASDMDYETVTDLLHLVMSADRTVYTRMIVNRLAVDEKVIKASEHFKDEKALVLPAQMFRFGAEMVAEETDEFSYSLL
jgi:hypothetical protein